MSANVQDTCLLKDLVYRIEVLFYNIELIWSTIFDILRESNLLFF